MEAVLLVILSVIDKLASAANRETRRNSSATPRTVMHTEWTGLRPLALSLGAVYEICF